MTYEIEQAQATLDVQLRTAIDLLEVARRRVAGVPEPSAIISKVKEVQEILLHVPGEALEVERMLERRQ